MSIPLTKSLLYAFENNLLQVLKAEPAQVCICSTNA